MPPMKARTLTEVRTHSEEPVLREVNILTTQSVAQPEPCETFLESQLEYTKMTTKGGRYSMAQVCSISIGPTPADEMQTIDAASFGLPHTQSFVNDSVLTPHEKIDRDSVVSKNMPLQPALLSRNKTLTKAQSQA